LGSPLSQSGILRYHVNVRGRRPRGDGNFAGYGARVYMSIADHSRQLVKRLILAQNGCSMFRIASGLEHGYEVMSEVTTNGSTSRAA
jgi:hypothetical protein